MTAIWSSCLTLWMKSGDRTINWISTGYRVAMKRLRTSLSRRLAFFLRRRRRRNLRRRRPPLRLPELWSLRKQKWSKLSQKRWWNLKRRKWFRCSKRQRWRRFLVLPNLPLQWQWTNHTLRSQMRDVSQLRGRHLSGRLTRRPRLEVMVSFLPRWTTRIMPSQLDQRVHIIRTELNEHFLFQKVSEW